MSQNEFAARLARIEKQHAQSRPPESAGPEESGLFDTPVQKDASGLPPLEYPPKTKIGIGTMAAWIGLFLGLAAIGGTGAAYVMGVGQSAGGVEVASTDPTSGLGDKAGAEGRSAGSDLADTLAPTYVGPTWWEGDEQLARLYGPDLNASRVVLAHRRIAVQSLPEGIGSTDAAAWEQKLAPQVFADYCDELRLVLAADCKIDGYTAESILDGRYVELAAKIQFSPSTWIGQAEQREGARPHKGEFKLTGGDYVADTPEMRTQLYAQAVSLCGGLRAVYGNCAIENIRLFSSGSGNEATIQAVASVYVYEDEAILNRNSLGARIDQVAQMRQFALMALGGL